MYSKPLIKITKAKIIKKNIVLLSFEAKHNYLPKVISDAYMYHITLNQNELLYMSQL